MNGLPAGTAAVKYEALGNDYLVVDAGPSADTLVERVMDVCDRHYGVGADGLLVVAPVAPSRYRVRILNPDGSEAEKSGNGMRIAAAHAVLALGASDSFVLQVPAGDCAVRVISRDDATVVTEVELGVPQIRDWLSVPTGQVDTKSSVVATVRGLPVSVGNPHFVVFGERVTATRVRELGPLLEHASDFAPARTNVQLAEVLSRSQVRAEIWERGAGYTLASGTSAAAVAAASMAQGLVDDQVEVVMAGGTLAVTRRADGMLSQVGPARRVFEARF